ncbi:MAG TPA: sugar transferase, partial [Gemmatimonadales bacterium]
MELLVDRTGPGTRLVVQDAWTSEGESYPDLVPLPAPAPRRGGRATRALNIVLALAALLALLPVFVLVAVLIKLTSRGPVFYCQERVGLDRRRPGRAEQNHRRGRDLGGRPFTIVKFRTMHVDAEQHS